MREKREKEASGKQRKGRKVMNPFCRCGLMAWKKEQKGREVSAMLSQSCQVIMGIKEG